jgi:hypothetical protein
MKSIMETKNNNKALILDKITDRVYETKGQTGENNLEKKLSRLKLVFC